MARVKGKSAYNMIREKSVKSIMVKIEVGKNPRKTRHGRGTLAHMT